MCKKSLDAHIGETMKYYFNMSEAFWRHPVIYTHRGFWEKHEEQNTLSAILMAEKKGFGAEIDVRSYGGQIQLSHDPLEHSKYCSFNELAEFRSPLAINLKEDGILGKIQDSGILDNNLYTFVFDGSIPQMLIAKKMGIRHALRISEYEKTTDWRSDFIWLDSFESDWWLGDSEILQLFRTHRVVVVSPELHSRDPKEMWYFLKKMMNKQEINFGICTDKPMEFQDFVYG